MGQQMKDSIPTHGPNRHGNQKVHGDVVHAGELHQRDGCYADYGNEGNNPDRNRCHYPCHCGE